MQPVCKCINWLYAISVYNKEYAWSVFYDLNSNGCTRPLLKDVVVDALRYCQREKGLILYAWCLMSSHLHLIAASQDGVDLSGVIRDFKKITSKKLIVAIKSEPESWREWRLLQPVLFTCLQQASAWDSCLPYRSAGMTLVVLLATSDPPQLSTGNTSGLRQIDPPFTITDSTISSLFVVSPPMYSIIRWKASLPSLRALVSTYVISG